MPDFGVDFSLEADRHFYLTSVRFDYGQWDFFHGSVAISVEEREKHARTAVERDEFIQPTTREFFRGYAEKFGALVAALQ